MLVRSLKFEPAESKLVVFENNRNGNLLEPVEVDITQSILIQGPWAITLEHVNGSSNKMQLDNLVDFKEDERLKTFAGVARYEKVFKLPDPENFRYIDLGIVKGVSEVILNGKSLGIKWYGFHRFSLDGVLIKDENKIEIRVTTVLGNYLKSLKDNPVTKKWIFWQKDSIWGGFFM